MLKLVVVSEFFPRVDFVCGKDADADLACRGVMPLLRLTVGGAAAVDEACKVSLAACVNDETRPQFHHIEVRFPSLVRLSHAGLAFFYIDHLPYKRHILSIQA